MIKVEIFAQSDDLTMADQKEDEDNEEEVNARGYLVKFESSSKELFSSSNPKQFSTLPAAVDLKRPPSNWWVWIIKTYMESS